MNRQKVPRQRVSFVKLFSGSVILSAIDRFSALVYGWIKNGVFGHLLSAYPKSGSMRTDGLSAAFADNPLYRRILLPLRRTVSAAADESWLFSLVRRFITFLLQCRLRVYGTFLLTFGLYTAAAYLLSYLGNAPTTPLSNLIAAAILVFASMPLLSANQSLSEALLASALAPTVFTFLGIRQSSLRAEGYRGRSNFAFIVGMVLGVITYAVPVLYLLFGFVAVFMLYRIFRTPELGVVVLFFSMPLLPTMALVALVLYTALCYCVKLFLGKRNFRFETVDIAALLFALVLALSGVFSFSPGSLKPALVLVCFMGGYFLTVLLIRTEEWLTRCSWAAILSASLISLYGVLQYLTGTFGGAAAWIDSTMFSDISTRVVSTLENPNMLAEYLILLFPLAAARFLTRGPRIGQAAALCASGVIGVCIILTWSRGAWLGLLFGGFVFVLIWSRRSMYLIFAGVASIPFLPLILPDSIIHRFTSIGNMTDTSTSYRVNIWRGTVHMLEDYWHCGIGIGEAAWDTVYPRYALAAIETAPHSHNLYLQTWIESGLIGLILLIAFLWLLCQANFSFYRELAAMRKTIVDSFSVTRLKPTARGDEPAIRPTAVRQGGSDPAAAEKEITALRLYAAAPLCGILATLVQGLTDYTWYNYRVYLMFWLAAGLSAAYVRRGRDELSHIRGAELARSDSPAEAAAEITISPAAPRKAQKNAKKGTASYV